MKEKRCSKCQTLYPETNEYFYYKNKSKKENGFVSWCKKCATEKTGTYQREHPLEVRGRKSKWYYKNKDHKLELDRIWAKEHLELRRNYQNKYYYDNKEKYIKYQKQRKQYKKHEISIEEWQYCKEYFDNSCAYCGKNIEQNYKEHKQDLCKDHFDNNGANDLTNCIPACKNCNSTKTYKNFEDFYNKNNQNYSKKRLNKILKWLNKDCYKFLDNINTKNI